MGQGLDLLGHPRLVGHHLVDLVPRVHLLLVGQGLEVGIRILRLRANHLADHNLECLLDHRLDMEDHLDIRWEDQWDLDME